MTYKEMANEFGCQVRIGKYGFKFGGRALIDGIFGHHIVQIFPLDGVILKGEDMTRAIMLDDELGLGNGKD